MEREKRLGGLLHLDTLKEPATARIQTILPDALVAFESPDVAYVWLTSPNALLNGLAPFTSALDSDVEAMKVRQLLRKIKLS